MEPLRITDPQLLVQVQKEIGALKRRSEASTSGVSSAKKLNVEVLGLIKKNSHIGRGFMADLLFYTIVRV